jgi:hypothetical protein
MTFSPNLDTTSLAPQMSIAGNGNCLGFPLTNSVSFSYPVSGTAGSIAYTCAGGLAIIVGTFTIPTGAPITSTAVVVGEGPHVDIVINGGGVTGAGDYAWSSVPAIAGCALGGTAGTSLLGNLSYAFVN